MLKTVFHKGKETKRTWRYEADTEGEVMGSLYLPKEKVKELGDPEQLEVTVEVL